MKEAVITQQQAQTQIPAEGISELPAIRSGLADLENETPFTIAKLDAAFAELKQLDSIEPLLAVNTKQQHILHQAMSHIGTCEFLVLSILNKFKFLSQCEQTFLQWINAQDIDGNTPLHLGVSCSTLIPFDYLHFGFDLMIRNNSGFTVPVLCHLTFACIDNDIYRSLGHPEMDREVAAVNMVQILAHAFAPKITKFMIEHESGITYPIGIFGSIINWHYKLVLESLAKFTNQKNAATVELIRQLSSHLIELYPISRECKNDSALENAKRFYQEHNIICVTNLTPKHVSLDIYTRNYYFHANCGYGMEKPGLHVFKRPKYAVIEANIDDVIALSTDINKTYQDIIQHCGLEPDYMIDWESQTVGNCTFHIYRMLIRAIFFIKELQANSKVDRDDFLLVAANRAGCAELDWYRKLQTHVIDFAVTKSPKLDFNHHDILLMCVIELANSDLARAKQSLRKILPGLIAGKDRRQAKRYFSRMLRELNMQFTVDREIAELESFGLSQISILVPRHASANTKRVNPVLQDPSQSPAVLRMYQPKTSMQELASECISNSKAIANSRRRKKTRH